MGVDLERDPEAVRHLDHTRDRGRDEAEVAQLDPQAAGQSVFRDPERMGEAEEVAGKVRGGLAPPPGPSGAAWSDASSGGAAASTPRSKNAPTGVATRSFHAYAASPCWDRSRPTSSSSSAARTPSRASRSTGWSPRSHTQQSGPVHMFRAFDPARDQALPSKR